MNYNEMTPDELMHYGVLGMKWGVRRSRNMAKKSESLRKKSSTYAKEGNNDKANKLNAKANKLQTKSKSVAEKTYNRSSRELNTINKRFDKAQNKAEVRMDYAQRLRERRMVSESRKSKAMSRAKNSVQFASKTARKGRNFYNAMEKAFSNTDYKMTEEHRKIGKRYTDYMDRQLNMMAYRFM